MTRIVKDPEERRQEIIAAAKKIFAAKGYEKTTMRDVMEEVRIAKGTIYHYFRSKEEIFETIVDESVEDYVQAMETLLKKTDGNALTRIAMLITAGNVEEKQSDIIDVLHSPGNIGIQTRQLAVTTLLLAPLYAEVIEAGNEEGIFDVENPLETAEFLLAGLQFLVDLGVYPWEPDTLQRRGMALPSLIEAQLNAPKGSFNFLINQ